MAEAFDFQTKKPLVREEPPTPEKPKEGMYLDTLKAKRDVLSSHYAMNFLRRSINSRIEKISADKLKDDEEVKQYEAVRDEYGRRKELFLASMGKLNEDDGQKISEFTSLTKIEIALSSLEKPAEVEIKAEATPVPDSDDQVSVETPVLEDIAGETRIHLGELADTGEVVSPVDAENPDRGTTMAEVDRMLKYSQDTARPLETAYWESKKTELFERQEAESNPDRSAPKGFLQRVRDSFDRARESFMGANRISGGSETVESRMSPLGLRKEAMESLSMQPKPTQEVGSPTDNAEAGPTQPEATPQQPEKEPKKASVWGWLKERGKGVWNFGIWEFHQAERFRSKTKEVAGDTKTLATLIQQERNLSLEEAQTEAQEIEKELKKQNIDGVGTAEFYQANSDIISERKGKENDQEIEYIIKSAGNDLVDKLAKYRGEAGQDVLTRENQLAFEADLRGELNKMRDGAVRKDFINFAKLMRRNLDENWHWRYVWGTAEAALGFVGVKYLVMKIEQVALAKLAAAEGAKGGAGAVEQTLTQGMHENVWTTLKEMAQNGPQHLNLDNSTLQELSQKVLDSNGMYEQEWVNQAAEGLRNSRVLPEGLPIKIPVEVLKVLGY